MQSQGLDADNAELEEELQRSSIERLWQQFLTNMDERGRAIEAELAQWVHLYSDAVQLLMATLLLDYDEIRLVDTNFKFINFSEERLLLTGHTVNVSKYFWN